MNEKSESIQSNMTSACTIYKELLMRPPTARLQQTSGGAGMSTSGNVVATPSHSLVTYDQDTNNLYRAKCACELDMVLSPLSKNNNGIFYTTKDQFNDHLEEARRRDEIEKNTITKSFLGIQVSYPKK